jgi:hypothetical protein
MLSEAGSGSLCKPPGVTPIGACRRCAVGASVPIELLVWPWEQLILLFKFYLKSKQ